MANRAFAFPYFLNPYDVRTEVTVSVVVTIEEAVSVSVRLEPVEVVEAVTVFVLVLCSGVEVTIITDVLVLVHGV